MSQTIDLTLDGLSCGHCVKRVKESLEQRPDVEQADVSITEAHVTGTASAEQLIETIKQAGYDASVSHPKAKPLAESSIPSEALTAVSEALPAATADDDDSQQLLLSGMSCASCVTRVQNALQSVPGVTQARPISGDIPLINVLLVDDHELVRAGIRRILEDIKGIKVVGEASCGEDAVKWCRANAVDVVLMDMSMPGIGGLEATRKIARSTADVKIIMLTVHTENPLPAKVMQAGAAGYLSKGAAPQEVVSAIRSVYSGQRYIASDIAQQMALSQIEPEKTESPFASLSERELQIMLMITKGQKVNEISEQLNLSPKTVNSYRYRMFSKLNIHGDVELTHLAIRHGLCNAETLSSQ